MSKTTLPETLIHTCRSFPKTQSLTDSSGAKITFGEALAKCLFLSGRLRAIWENQEKVGILVPPSVGGVLVNWTALLMGKVPVNLNYTLSQDGIISCLEQCGITDLVVSGKLMKRLKLDLPVRIHVLEELVAAPRFLEKLRAGFLAKCTPAKTLLKRLGGSQAEPDDLATIIFSSGSTGDPKGVMLSHRNIISNVGQVRDIYSFTPDDCMLGVLPFFHSFGFMATIAGPAVAGFGCAYHFNPMEAKVIGTLAKEQGVTIVIATPTFLQFYLRGVNPGQLEKLRLVVVGAEKLPPKVATAFEKKFGCLPLEAYGCTECSPGIAANGLENNRPGSIGRLLPEMEARLAHPDSGADVPSGQHGLLKVKGPNVMMGYLGMPEETAEVLKDGWYDTGDIVRIDDDGILWIEGRKSRFSKIGGEMVPHGTIEEELNELADQNSQIFAVTGVPHVKKGEQLVVVHTADKELLEEVLNKLSDSPLPNLWKPKPGQFLKVGELPILGTGKIDLKGLQKLARG